MEKIEVKERFFDRFFYAEDGSRDWERWRISDPSVVLEFIFEELDKAREEGKREQLKEDIEQVEMFLPKEVSDTDKYWIPTQILLELEDDLKLLKTKE